MIDIQSNPDFSKHLKQIWFVLSGGLKNRCRKASLYLFEDLSMGRYSRLPITRTFEGNRKNVRVIGISKKIAESKVKNSFYCTVNILVTFNCRNVQ